MCPTSVVMIRYPQCREGIWLRILTVRSTVLHSSAWYNAILRKKFPKLLSSVIKLLGDAAWPQRRGRDDRIDHARVLASRSQQHLMRTQQ